MKGKMKKFSKRDLIVPLLLALPVIFAIVYVLVRHGETAGDLIQVAIKMAVVS